MLDLNHIKNSRILIAALDWGFGHTTRTSVLIKKLLEQNNSILFAGTEKQIDFLKGDHLTAKTTLLEGYNITLDSRKNTYVQVAIQIPKIIKQIRYENEWIKNLCSINTFDYIISDNRYGFYHTEIPSIILTHQLNLQLPFAKKITNRILHYKLKKFNACWVPDYHNRSLSGDLSVGKLQIPTFYIGPLSRFEIALNEQFKYDFLFIISGPPPESQEFYKKVVRLVKEHNLNAAIATPFSSKSIENFDNEKIFENANTASLNQLINDSKTIISKTGYTTIMDLIPYDKSIFLLPTKNQFEQEYLYSLHQSKNEKNRHVSALFNGLFEI